MYALRSDPARYRYHRSPPYIFDNVSNHLKWHIIAWVCSSVCVLILPNVALCSLFPPICVAYKSNVNRNGRPGTSSITEKHQIDWGTYMSSRNDVIYIRLDVRGSKGQSKQALYRQLGGVEVQDQIDALRYGRHRIYILLFSMHWTCTVGLHRLRCMRLPVFSVGSINLLRYRLGIMPWGDATKSVFYTTTSMEKSPMFHVNKHTTCMAVGRNATQFIPTVSSAFITHRHTLVPGGKGARRALLAWKMGATALFNRNLMNVNWRLSILGVMRCAGNVPTALALAHHNN